MTRNVDRLNALLERLLPRPRDLAWGLAAGAVGFVPLAGLRLYIAKARVETADALDLWYSVLGEIETWTILGLCAALLHRRMGDGRVGRAFRVFVHLVVGVLLCLSVMELVFFQVTGTRVDFDLLGFFVRDTAQVLPVVMSEVKSPHVVALFTAFGLALAPLRLALAPAWPRRWGFAALLLILPTLLIELPGRPRPVRSLREMQPALVEQLYWDALDRWGEGAIGVIPPQPGEMETLRVRRVGDDRPPPNVVVVFLESVGLRNTSLGEAALGVTPNLVDLARRGRLVEQAFAVVPHTSKALVTSLCGTWPQLVSDIREAKIGGLPNRCLPDLLKDAGYRTAFFQTARESFEYRAELTHRMGFDFFRARDQLRRSGFDRVNYFGIEDRAMLVPGVEWSTAVRDRPFFAAYLTLTSHHDYGVPDKFAVVDVPGVDGRREEHLNAVRYVDTFLGDLVQAYEDAGLLDNTLFVILGDHGEAFEEHGRSQHDLVIWEEGLRIPMVLYGPGVLGDSTAPIEGARQQIDLVPTVLDVAGLEVTHGALPGASLLDTVPADRELFHSCWRSYRCLARRAGALKYIDHYLLAAPQVFDLAADPDESRDLSDHHEGELEALQADVRTWRARVNGRYEARVAMELERRQWPDTETQAVASWDGKVDLLGCDTLSELVIPAQAAWFRCRWRANEPIKRAWRLRASLEGTIKGTETTLHPLSGQLPVYKWRQGWVVEDEFFVRVPSGARPGVTTLLLSWEGLSGDAIPTATGEDRVVAGQVEVLPRPVYEGIAVSSKDEADEEPAGGD